MHNIFLLIEIDRKKCFRSNDLVYRLFNNCRFKKQDVLVRKSLYSLSKHFKITIFFTIRVLRNKNCLDNIRFQFQKNIFYDFIIIKLIIYHVLTDSHIVLINFE